MGDPRADRGVDGHRHPRRRRANRGRGARALGLDAGLRAGRRPARRVGRARLAGALRRRVVAAPGDALRVRQLPPVLQALPRLHLAPQRAAAAARRAGTPPQDGPRERRGGEHARRRQGHGPELEAAPRPVHLHRVRPLHGRVPNDDHQEAADPARPHDRPARPPQRLRGRDPQGAGGGAWQAEPRAGGRRDRPGGRVGLHDLPVVRGVVPPVHLVRGQDRRDATAPRAREGGVPCRSRAGVPRHGGQREPMAAAARDPRRLGQGPRRAARLGRRRVRGPVLGRVRGRLRRRRQAHLARPRQAVAGRRRPIRNPRRAGTVHRRRRAPSGQRVPLPDVGRGRTSRRWTASG